MGIEVNRSRITLLCMVRPRSLNLLALKACLQIGSIPMMRPERMLEGKDLGPQNSTPADLNKVDY
jgi:hypothetical protein